jgi:hypothetical protein
MGIGMVDGVCVREMKPAALPVRIPGKYPEYK